MSKFHDKQKYLEHIEKGKSHRQIAKNVKFSVSANIIRDELIQDGIIVQSKVVMDPKTRKNFIYYKVTDKKIQREFIQLTWDDGTPKSHGNAFDLSIAKGLFNKSELAASQNKGKPMNYKASSQIIAYSRA